MSAVTLEDFRASKPIGGVSPEDFAQSSEVGDEAPLPPDEQAHAERLSDFAANARRTRPERLSGSVEKFLGAAEFVTETVESMALPAAQVRKGVAGIRANIGNITLEEFQQIVEAIDNPPPLLPHIPQQEGTAAKVGAGAGNAIIDFANGMVGSPDAILHLGLATVPSAFRKHLLTSFAAIMAVEAPQQLDASIDSMKEGDIQGAAQHLTAGSGALVMGRMIGKDAAKSPEPSLPDRAAKSAILAKALDASDLKVPSETGTVPVPREAGPLRPGDAFKSELPNVSPELQALAPQTAAVVTRATELPKVEAVIEEPPLFISSPSLEAGKVQVPAKLTAPDAKPEPEPAKPYDSSANRPDLIGLNEPLPAEAPPGPKTVLPDGATQKEAARSGAQEAQAEVTSPGLTGMGAAVPSEFGKPGDHVSNMFAAIDADRAAMGKEPMPETRARTWDEDNSRALAKMNRDPGWIQNLISEVSANPRPLLSWENAGLVWQRHAWKAEANNALARIARAFEDNQPEALEAAKLDAARFESNLEALDLAVGRNGTGSEAGRSLQAQKMAGGDDFTLIEMRLKARAAKGGEPLTDVESKELADLHAKLDAADKAAAQAAQAAQERITTLEIEKNIAEARAVGPAYEPRVLAAAEKFAKFMDKKGDDALARIKARLGRTSAGVDPTILSDVGILGAAKLTRGIVDFAKWTDAMTRDLGEWFREHAQEAWDASQKVFASENENFHKGVDKATNEKVKRATDLPGRITDVSETIKARAASGDGSPIHSEVRKLVRLLVEQDPKITRESLIDAVHAVLTESMPDITRLEAMDAISGRGKFWTPAQDEVSKTVRDLGTQIRLVGHQIDVEAGRPIPRTGYQPEKMTDAARREQQILNDLKRRHGVVVTDPAAQLGSALAARKTYYTHRIADLKNEISTRERIVKNRSLPPTDPALEALKVEYEKVKADHAEIFTKPGLTDAQRLKLAIAAAERNEASWTERLAQAKKGNFSTGSTARKITSPELEAIKARAELAKEEVAELRDADSIITESGQRKALETSIAEYERKLKAGEFAPEGPRSGPDTEAVTALKKKRADLASRLAELRAASPEAKAEAARKAYDAAKAANEELARRINEGDIAARQKPGPPVTDPALAALRAETADLTKMLRELQNASKPRKTPEQIALQSLKTRLATEKADLQDRIAKGDFSPRRKPPREFPLDTETAAAKAQVAALQQQYGKLLARYRYEQKSRLAKIWHGTKQTRGAIVNIASSYDFSAPRQALPAILSNTTRLITNPVRGPGMLARPFGKMFAAWSSERRAGIIEQKRKNRPNAKSGADKMAGIEYTELNSDSFSRFEENAHSILDDWAALPFKTGNLAKTVTTAPVKAFSRGVRMSNRAFITFLNETRAELFDELLRANFKDRAPAAIDLKVIGNMVNIATGRGKLSPKTASVASEFLWAPKLLASRVQILTGQPLWGGANLKGSGKARLIVAKEYARIIAGGFLLYQVSRLFDDKKEENWTSSDHGKIVRGDTRIDLWGGLQQVTTFGARAGSGRTTSLDGKEKKSDLGTLIMNFARSKLRPDWGSLWDAYDLIFHQVKPGHPESLGEVAGNLVTPLPLRDIVQIMEAHGFTEGMIVEALGQFGAGVSHYEGKPQR